MSLELPPSSSLYQGRVPPPPRRRKIRRTLRRSLAAVCALAALAFGASLAYERLSSPRIARLDPAVGEPGQVIRIAGRNFGAQRRDSRVEVDGVSPTASSYVSWADGEVAVRLPAAVDSGLVYLVTRHGKSNPKLFMNRARLPVRASGARAGRSGPFIASTSTDSGPIGSLLVLNGLDFGANRENAIVTFSWSADPSSVSQGSQAVPTTVANTDADFGYELWSDKEIRVRVPDGASTGVVSVSRDKGKGNNAFFRIIDAPGVKRYTDRRTYAVSQSVSIKKIKVSGANELYLWTPRPAETAYQRAVVLSQEPSPLIPDYRGTAIFRYKDLTTGTDLSLSQSYLVQVYAVESDVKADKILVKPKDPPSLMAHYLAADERVPAGAPEIQALAKKITGGERNPWRAARLVWDWLGKNIAWAKNREHGRVLDVLSDKTADSYSYALLACALLRAAGVPSLPVAGYLVDTNRTALRHYWIEVYLYGLGWLPLDPVLGSGASPGVDVAWEDRQRYFGSMDNRHIVFSRGFNALVPMAQNGRRVSKDRRWSLQSFYEEAAGGLESYSSFWGDVEVTGMY